MDKEFLLEIGCEEIPAWVIPAALAELNQRFQTAMQANHLQAGETRTFATPRRLILVADKVPAQQADREEVITGPPVSIAFDDQGQPTKAALGFIKKQGVEPDQLEVIDTDKGSYAGFRRKVVGRETGDILAEILPELFRNFPFPKTMYWQRDKFRFVRPIRNLLALLDGRIVSFEVAGIRSSNISFGHRGPRAAERRHV